MIEEPSANRSRVSSIRVAMFHFGRCGSTVVGNLLGQHPALRWDGEVFEKAFTGNMRMGRLLLGYPALLLRLRMWRWWRLGYGFETKLHPAYHLNNDVLDMSISRYVDLLRRAGFDRFVVLERQNYLRQQLSEELGRERGRVWHQKVGTEPVLQSVSLPVDNLRVGGFRLSLLESFESRDEVYTEIRRELQDDATLWLTYENEILRKPEAAYDAVCRFIGLEPASVHVRFTRTNPFPLREMILNWDEVAEVVRGTRYEWMLEEEAEESAPEEKSTRPGPRIADSDSGSIS